MSTIDPKKLPTWQSILQPDDADDDANQPKKTNPRSRFPLNRGLNGTLVLWSGDLTDLTVGAVVCSTNERLTERVGVGRRIHFRAGGQLAVECRSTEGCHTGDAIVTKGYRLPAPYVIHTVGPRFSVKYLTAAENALHGCYRRSLEQAVEHKLRSVAFCVINTESKGYPKEQACHVAVRTIRRFLEKYPNKFDHVILAMDNETDLAIYSAVLPLYFPRSNSEEKQAIQNLPQDVGNDLGGTTIKERDIRIRTSLLSGDEKTANNLTSVDQVAYVAARIRPRTQQEGQNLSRNGPLIDPKLATRQDDPDIAKQRASRDMPNDQKQQIKQEYQYQDYLARARKADLSHLEKYRFVYVSGQDSLGRPVVVFVASHLPAQNVDMEQVLLYIIHVLDPIVTNDYNLIYLHTNIADANKPAYSWMRKAYGIFNRKYKKNMKNLYIVHPSWWVKALFMFARPFISGKFYKKLHYVYYLMDMYEMFDAKTLRIPNHIIKYDQITNVQYYNQKYARSASRDDRGDL
mmetsp:Transcript_6401/g.11791  ORF Transcript_6401/g.11791 Transcript_6401/m.11791 type:complete len:517 (+) Transcript_6401:117-1667(+)|eukprot:CAMPEP_0197529872 /NCGR_PEP_ID=MMETSP1318-20131121/29911_1 /TAXON_ID=552666 /ORGANISM="Partenskyella glossopodia, Strain RCC365" /LENGTH=516 /DNA_ID=CAMNT_0043085487 /DNA_START=100 /DNA_END=1650 /DNA_ORIENTATION=-